MERTETQMVKLMMCGRPAMRALSTRMTKGEASVRGKR